MDSRQVGAGAVPLQADEHDVEHPFSFVFFPPMNSLELLLGRKRSADIIFGISGLALVCFLLLAVFSQFQADLLRDTQKKSHYLKSLFCRILFNQVMIAVKWHYGQFILLFFAASFDVL